MSCQFQPDHCIVIVIQKSNINKISSEQYEHKNITMISIEGNATNVSFDMNKITSQKSFNNMINLYCSNFMLINLTNINPNISNIYFTNLYLREIELHYFKNLNKLIHLSVQTNNINNIKNYTFMDLNELIYLVLSKNNITHIESGAFT